jgi:glycosyltransferase involved in cell wall biosynthesis
MEKSIVLFFSEVNWSYLRQRHHFFAENYAKKGHQVIYVGKVGIRYPKIKEVFSFLFSKEVQKRTDTNKIKNITFYKGFFLPPINFFFNIVNTIFYLSRFTKSLSGSKVIIHFYQPTRLIQTLINKLNDLRFEVTAIYDCVQDYRFHPSRLNGLIQIEKQLVSKCRLTITDSKVNYERLSAPRKIIIPPGVDTNHFKIKSHSDYSSTPIHKILYYGNIRQDLDIDLINQISLSGNFEVTLIGILNLDRSKLHSKVQILNAVKYQELPGVIKNYDALILPYDVKNQFTKAIIPAKFFECICTGLPVLSTKMESTSDYHKYLTIISDESDFKNLDIKNLDKKLVRELDEIVNQSSWEKRFQTFYDKIK